MTPKLAYKISNIIEYGKLMAFCIQNDVCVFRTYWDEREKLDRYYSIDWKEKRCYYSKRKYFEENGYSLYEAVFEPDKYGNYKIIDRIPLDI